MGFLEQPYKQLPSRESLPKGRKIYPNTQAAIDSLFALIDKGPVDKDGNPIPILKKEYHARFTDQYVVHAIKDLKEQMMKKIDKLEDYDGDVFRAYIEPELPPEYLIDDLAILCEELGDATPVENMPNRRGMRLELLRLLIENFEKLNQELRQQQSGETGEDLVK